MNDKFEIGTIIDIRQIEIKQNNYLPTIGGGALGGAVIGGLLGSKKKIGKNMLKGAAIGAIGLASGSLPGAAFWRSAAKGCCSKSRS